MHANVSAVMGEIHMLCKTATRTAWSTARLDSTCFCSLTTLLPLLEEGGQHGARGGYGVVQLEVAAAVVQERADHRAGAETVRVERAGKPL